MIQSLRTKNKNGEFDDIVTGFDTLEDCIKNKRFTGRVIGRFANRIHKGKFKINNKVNF
jgi:aldose 1-epimerase